MIVSLSELLLGALSDQSAEAVCSREDVLVGDEGSTTGSAIHLERFSHSRGQIKTVNHSITSSLTSQGIGSRARFPLMILLFPRLAEPEPTEEVLRPHSCCCCWALQVA